MDNNEQQQTLNIDKIIICYFKCTELQEMRKKLDTYEKIITVHNKLKENIFISGNLYYEFNELQQVEKILSMSKPNELQQVEGISFTNSKDKESSKKRKNS